MVSAKNYKTKFSPVRKCNYFNGSFKHHDAVVSCKKNWKQFNLAQNFKNLILDPFWGLFAY